MIDQHTICAISTAPGSGAIAVVRLSGNEAIAITDTVFHSAKEGKKLSGQKANTLHFGTIRDGDTIIDEVVVALFKAPHSFTGEDIVEISCHGSVYIQQAILQLLLQNGARMAQPGEFTRRAFLNGKMDLSQAEAVADVISASSEAAHHVAINQMRGGISTEIKNLRDQLLQFTSLVELELDFSEEDVEFANREQLLKLTLEIDSLIEKLAGSFKYGNAIKNGIPVAIAGDANVGKSTLLNALLNDERAIVSEIAGTTRDVIEDVVIIDGIQFRFIDTAGIRTTTDHIETLGIERTFKKIEQAEIVLTIIDATMPFNDIIIFLTRMSEKLHTKKSALVINKIDCADGDIVDELIQMGETMEFPVIPISAKEKHNIEGLTDFLNQSVQANGYNESDVIITNLRHYESLTHAGEAIKRVIEGLNAGISGDFLSQDIRECLHYLGEITGQISTDEVLGNIFEKFCIGK
ncbi:MAG: tRNA uridine-5-carboxymethylaminomethyl(34) synthesis GTPase MnmE [Prolixibacteraceae bacterium]|nr:tRNA uridine-5-carboxymethylaminomethyl(34) synthesis GTPase MnmE [Prolixibacteraceae bacterium]